MSEQSDRIVRLSASQQELLDAMRGGVRVYYMTGMNAHAFRTDTMRHCTSTIDALKRRGLVEAYNSDWRGCVYRSAPNKE